MYNKVSISKKCIAVLLVLLPIVSVYNFGIPVIEATSVVIIICGAFYNRRNLVLDPSLVMLLFYTILQTLGMSVFIPQLTITRTLGKILRIIIIYYAFYSQAIKLVEKQYLIDFYTKIVYIISAGIIIQYVLLIVFRIGSSFLLPGMTLASGESSTELINYFQWKAAWNLYRPCTFFIEPAHQAEYTLPWIAIKLFELDKKKINIRLVLLITFCQCLTGSSIAIFGSVLVWGMYFFKGISKLERRVISRILISVPLVGVAILGVLSISTIRDNIMIKISSFSDFREFSSFSIRFFRGFYCFNEMGLLHQMFGTGYNNFEYYYNNHQIHTIYDAYIDSSQIAYMSGFTKVLCNIGLIGLILLFLFIVIQTIRRNGMKMLPMIIVLIVMMLVSDIWDNSVYFLVVILLFGESPQNDNDIENMMCA